MPQCAQSSIQRDGDNLSSPLRLTGPGSGAFGGDRHSGILANRGTTKAQPFLSAKITSTQTHVVSTIVTP
jgi:hypothetical protein